MRREKQKARQLRKSRWWHNKISSSNCYYCEKKLTKDDATMDHVTPLSQGGSTTKGNVVVACKGCNTKKKDMTAVEWLLYQEKLKNS